MKYDIEFRNGRTMVTIRKGIYGLPNAGRIAQDKLILHLIVDGGGNNLIIKVRNL